MGEIADMMIEGMLDYQTGEYLGDPVGYPRTYRTPSLGCRSNCKELNGVMYYLSMAGIKSTATATKFIRIYCKEKLEYEGSLKGCAKEIQKNFNKFRRYVKKEL